MDGHPGEHWRGPTKTLAKVANKLAKKEAGICVFKDPQQTGQALESTKVEEVWGIGNQYAKLLKEHSIYTAWEFSQANELWVRQRTGVVGQRLVREFRGDSCLELVPPAKKAICTSRSFGRMVSTKMPLEEVVSNFTVRCAEKQRKQGSCGSMLSVFLGTYSFRKDLPQYHPSRTIRLPVATAHPTEFKLLKYALATLRDMFRSGYQYQKAGILVSGIVLGNQVQQHFLMRQTEASSKKLTQAVDQINGKLGRNTSALPCKAI